MNLLVRIKQSGWFLYEKLVKINDSPSKVAAGFGLGVFTGIFPGIGPMVSLGLAFLFKVNRGAAVLGSLLTNTWVSVVTFVGAVKIGSVITGSDGRQVYESSRQLIKDFSWKDLLDVSLLNIILPIFLGYLLIGMIMGLISYGVIFLILCRKGSDPGV